MVFAQEIEYSTLDRMFVKPDVPLEPVHGTGQVRLLAYHSYPITLRHFRLIPKSEDFHVTVEPAEMGEFKPTTLETFIFTLTVKGKPAGDRAALHIGMAADELHCDKQFTITVPLTEKAAREINESLAIPVGEIEIHVRRFGEEIYYLYVFPVLVMLGWLLWRKHKANTVKHNE